MKKISKIITFIIISILLGQFPILQADQTSEYEDLKNYINKQHQVCGRTYIDIARELGVNPKTVSCYAREKTKQPRGLLVAYQKKIPILIERENFKPSIVASFVKKLKQDGKNIEVPSPKISIPFRGIADDKDAKGTFYDHFVFQTITSFPTQILLPEDISAEKALTNMRHYANSLPYGLLKGEQDHKSGKLLPFIQTDTSSIDGLLVITGRMRDREDDLIRQKHERALIRHALLRGQPILAICAGSWRLWQSLWIANLYPNYDIESLKETRLKNFLKEVQDHSASRMMSLSMNNPKVNYNTMMHGLELKEPSLLSDMMTLKNESFPETIQVNSVHWKAPIANPQITQDADQYPVGIEASAWSKNTKKLENKNRHGHILDPEEGVIEGFSSFYGSPIIGIGWHPEASNKDDEEEKYPIYNRMLIQRMAKAGHYYQIKHAMLQEFTTLASQFKKPE